MPDYAIVFTQLVLIEGLIDSVSGSAICPALATGKIKVFYLITGTLYILTLPIAYAFLKIGFDPTSTMVVSIVISVVALIARACLLVGLINLNYRSYFYLVLRLLVSTIIIGICTYASMSLVNNLVTSLFLSTAISTVLHIVVYLFFVCSQQDRSSIIRIVNNKLHRNGNQK